MSQKSSVPHDKRVTTFWNVYLVCWLIITAMLSKAAVFAVRYRDRGFESCLRRTCGFASDCFVLFRVDRGLSRGRVPVQEAIPSHIECLKEGLRTHRKIVMSHSTYVLALAICLILCLRSFYHLRNWHRIDETWWDEWKLRAARMRGSGCGLIFVHDYSVSWVLRQKTVSV
jgi:hypothetical protein